MRADKSFPVNHNTTRSRSAGARSFSQQEIFTTDQHVASCPKAALKQQHRSRLAYRSPRHSPNIAAMITRTLKNVAYVGKFHVRRNRRDQISSDWSRLAMVLDQLFLWVNWTITGAYCVYLVSTVPFINDSRQSLLQPHPSTPLGYAAAGVERQIRMWREVEATHGVILNDSHVDL